MEDLGNSLFFDQVPPSWSKRAYASLNGLSNWYADLILRIKELEAWTSDFSLPASVWLPGFFNPQSFLTAIMQSTGKSFSEALIFASTNPQYDDKVFIESQVQYMKIPSSEHGENMLCSQIVFVLTFRTIYAHNMFSSYSERVVFMC